MKTDQWVSARYIPTINKGWGGGASAPKPYMYGFLCLWVVQSKFPSLVILVAHYNAWISTSGKIDEYANKIGYF